MVERYDMYEGRKNPQGDMITWEDHQAEVSRLRGLLQRSIGITAAADLSPELQRLFDKLVADARAELGEGRE